MASRQGDWWLARRDSSGQAPDAAVTTDAVLQVLKTTDSDWKRLAIVTFKAIGPRAKPALPALIAASRETEDLDGSFAFGGSNVVLIAEHA